MLPIIIAAFLSFWFIQTGRSIVGTVIFVTAIGLHSLIGPFLRSGLGVPNSITSLVLIASLCLATLPPRYIGRVLMGSLMISIASIIIDIFGNPGRPMAELNLARWVFALAMLTVFAISFAREFASLDIRTKIVIGILSTGGFALTIIVFFALYQFQQITTALSTRLDSSVTQLAEVQLRNTIAIEAMKADQEFKEIINDVANLAQNWAVLHRNKIGLYRGSYWDARISMRRLEGGQYGNSTREPSSVFVPVGRPLDESLVTDLNASAYLDFYVPATLASHPSLLAVYAIDTRGVTRFYPNIDLASILEPDFDATQRPYYEITAPLYNPQRQTRWSIPYVDATGAGLVVTVAAPVYNGDEFIGIVAGDMRLAEVTGQINSLKIGETGYAFMLDDAGRILFMPPAGYAMFDIRPEDFSGEDFSKKSVLGLGNYELQSVTNRMTSGGNGLLTVNVNGTEFYVAFSAMRTNGYSLALVVPTSELQGPIISARQQTQQQLRQAARTAAIILVILLIIAVAVSLWLGQFTAAPIRELTKVATRIAAGDLSVQANATTTDEIGTLAYAFNMMTSRLRETLDGLERMVAKRTNELLSANERNERRARQFESIAKVARTISSTRDLEVLLTQITTIISREFGFYHIGIFLLDSAKDYAILSATNSQGGKIMLEHGHRLKVGETSLVGYVTQSGKPRVASDTELDSTFYKNPDLPDTHSEIALPLHIGEEIIGALDVQSTEPNVFSPEDINILSTLADQVSIALQNAQQFEQTRKALNEAEELSKQFVQTGWQQFTKNENLIGIRHTGARSVLLHKKNNKVNGEVDPDQEQSRRKPRGASLSLPIKLRGEEIGSVDIHTPDNRPWDPDELDIATAIIERAAISMENARLLQESQRLASKEAKIGEVTAKISASINMRNVLQTAVEELGRALPGSEVVIQFQTDQTNGKAGP